MKTILIILAVIYGLTSVFIGISGLGLAKATNLPKGSTTMSKFVATLGIIIWCILPLLRWGFLVGVYTNFQKYGRKPLDN